MRRNIVDISKRAGRGLVTRLGMLETSCCCVLVSLCNGIPVIASFGSASLPRRSAHGRIFSFVIGRVARGVSLLSRAPENCCCKHFGG